MKLKYALRTVALLKANQENVLNEHSNVYDNETLNYIK